MTKLNKATAFAAVAFGTLAAATSPGLAGGDAIQYGGGLARHRGVAVPVPAPAPVPDLANAYYLRVDVAYSMSDTDKYRSTSWQADAARTDSYLDTFPRYGFGIGYQFSSWFRMDVTYDWRRDVHSRANGLVGYSVGNTAGGGTNATIAMRDTINDSFTSTNATGMINAYVDAPGWNNFTPYFGLGIGFVRHQLKGRSFSRTIQCVDALDCDPNTAGDGGADTLSRNYTVTAGENSVGLAFAAMLGASYKIWDNTKLDIGYRFLHLEGAKVAGRSADLMNFENLIIPEQNIHELRAGLRFEIN